MLGIMGLPMVLLYAQLNTNNVSLPWGPTTVNQSSENITIDPSQLVTININHSDVHNSGFAFIKYLQRRNDR